MRTGKRKMVLGVFLVGVASAAVAIAGRNVEWEVGYFGPGGELNGSVTYPCGGGKIVEGELVGTPVTLWSAPCEPYDPPGDDP